MADKVIIKAKETLSDLISKLSKVEIEEMLNVELSKKEICTNEVFKTKLSEITNLKKHIIYIININLNNNIIQKYFLDFRNKNKLKNKISKFNSEFLNQSKVLYVGSSTTKTIDRFKQHFGLVKQNSYGLYLNDWLETDFRLNIKIYNLKGENFEINKEILESVEQAFWDLNLPLFGKRSGQL